MKVTHVISHKLASQFLGDQLKHIENKMMRQIHEVTKMTLTHIYNQTTLFANHKTNTNLQVNDQNKQWNINWYEMECWMYIFCANGFRYFIYKKREERRWQT